MFPIPLFSLSTLSSVARSTATDAASKVYHITREKCSDIATSLGLGAVDEQPKFNPDDSNSYYEVEQDPYEGEEECSTIGAAVDLLELGTHLVYEQAKFEISYGVQNGALNLYNAAKGKCPGTVGKVEQFAGSVLGKQVISSATAGAMETLGMMVGSSAPGAMFAFSAGTRVAGSMVSDSEETGTAQHRLLIVWSAGIGAALTVTVLSTAITYLTADSTVGTAAYAFLMTNLGTIVGGLEGLRLVGAEPAMTENVFNSYPVRTFQYLTAQGAAEVISSVLPVPRPLAVLLKTIAGTAGYHAGSLTQFAIQYYNRDPSQAQAGICNPGILLKAQLMKSYGSMQNFYESTQGSIDSAAPYVSFIPFAARFIEGTLDRVIDQEVGANALVRSFNEYMDLIQDEDIRKATKALTSCTSEDTVKRKNLQQVLIECINEKISNRLGLLEGGMAFAFQIKAAPMVHQYVESLVATIQEKEIEMTGFELSDREKNKDLLEVHAVSYLTLALIQMKRALTKSVENKDLTDAEIKGFYRNLNSMIFSPYTGTSVGRFAQRVSGAVVQEIVENVPLLVPQALGLKEETKQIMEAKKSGDKPSSFFQRIPFLSQMKTLFTSAWDRIASAFRRKEEETIFIPSPSIAYTDYNIQLSPETPTYALHSENKAVCDMQESDSSCVDSATPSPKINYVFPETSSDISPSA